MASFLNSLKVEDWQSNKWRLLAPLDYVTTINGAFRQITVPEGFVTDLASIPRPLQAIIPKVAKHRRAAVLHDYLYAIRGNLPDVNLSRAQCDGLFLEAMESTGVRFTRRWAMYLGVRSGGWAFWKQN